MTGFGKFLVIIVGLILLLPGLCGAWGLFTAAIILGDLRHLGETAAYGLLFGIPSLVGLVIGWLGIKVLKTAFRKPAVSNDTPARQWTAEPPIWPSEPPDEK